MAREAGRFAANFLQNTISQLTPVPPLLVTPESPNTPRRSDVSDASLADVMNASRESDVDASFTAEPMDKSATEQNFAASEIGPEKEVDRLHVSDVPFSQDSIEMTGKDTDAYLRGEFGAAGNVPDLSQPEMDNYVTSGYRAGTGSGIVGNSQASFGILNDHMAFSQDSIGLSNISQVSVRDPSADFSLDSFETGSQPLEAAYSDYYAHMQEVERSKRLGDDLANVGVGEKIATEEIAIDKSASDKQFSRDSLDHVDSDSINISKEQENMQVLHASDVKLEYKDEMSFDQSQLPVINLQIGITEEFATPEIMYAAEDNKKGTNDDIPSEQVRKKQDLKTDSNTASHQQAQAAFCEPNMTAEPGPNTEPSPDLPEASKQTQPMFNEPKVTSEPSPNTSSSSSSSSSASDNKLSSDIPVIRIGDISSRDTSMEDDMPSSSNEEASFLSQDQTSTSLMHLIDLENVSVFHSQTEIGRGQIPPNLEGTLIVSQEDDMIRQQETGCEDTLKISELAPNKESDEGFEAGSSSTHSTHSTHSSTHSSKNSTMNMATVRYIYDDIPTIRIEDVDEKSGKGQAIKDDDVDEEDKEDDYETTLDSATFEQDSIDVSAEKSHENKATSGPPIDVSVYLIKESPTSSRAATEAKIDDISVARGEIRGGSDSETKSKDKNEPPLNESTIENLKEKVDEVQYAKDLPEIRVEFIDDSIDQDGQVTPTLSQILQEAHTVVSGIVEQSTARSNSVSDERSLTDNCLNFDITADLHDVTTESHDVISDMSAILDVHDMSVFHSQTDVNDVRTLPELNESSVLTVEENALQNEDEGNGEDAKPRRRKRVLSGPLPEMELSFELDHLDEITSLHYEHVDTKTYGKIPKDVHLDYSTHSSTGSTTQRKSNKSSESLPSETATSIGSGSELMAREKLESTVLSSDYREGNVFGLVTDIVQEQDDVFDNSSMADMGDKEEKTMTDENQEKVPGEIRDDSQMSKNIESQNDTSSDIGCTTAENNFGRQTEKTQINESDSDSESKPVNETERKTVHGLLSNISSLLERSFPDDTSLDSWKKQENDSEAEEEDASLAEVPFTAGNKGEPPADGDTFETHGAPVVPGNPLSDTVSGLDQERRFVEVDIEDAVDVKEEDKDDQSDTSTSEASSSSTLNRVYQEYFKNQYGRYPNSDDDVEDNERSGSSDDMLLKNIIGSAEASQEHDNLMPFDIVENQVKVGDDKTMNPDGIQENIAEIQTNVAAEIPSKSEDIKTNGSELQQNVAETHIDSTKDVKDGIAVDKTGNQEGFDEGNVSKMQTIHGTLSSDTFEEALGQSELDQGDTLLQSLLHSDDVWKDKSGGLNREETHDALKASVSDASNLVESKSISQVGDLNMDEVQSEFNQTDPDIRTIDSAKTTEIRKVEKKIEGTSIGSELEEKYNGEDKEKEGAKPNNDRVDNKSLSDDLPTNQKANDTKDSAETVSKSNKETPTSSEVSDTTQADTSHLQPEKERKPRLSSGSEHYELDLAIPHRFEILGMDAEHYLAMRQKFSDAAVASTQEDETHKEKNKDSDKPPSQESHEEIDLSVVDDKVIVVNKPNSESQNKEVETFANSKNDNTDNKPEVQRTRPEGSEKQSVKGSVLTAIGAYQNITVDGGLNTNEKTVTGNDVNKKPEQSDIDQDNLSNCDAHPHINIPQITAHAPSPDEITEEHEIMLATEAQKVLTEILQQSIHSPAASPNHSFRLEVNDRHKVTCKVKVISNTSGFGGDGSFNVGAGDISRESADAMNTSGITTANGNQSQISTGNATLSTGNISISTENTSDNVENVGETKCELTLCFTATPSSAIGGVTGNALDSIYLRNEPRGSVTEDSTIAFDTNASIPFDATVANASIPFDNDEQRGTLLDTVRLGFDSGSGSEEVDTEDEVEAVRREMRAAFLRMDQQREQRPADLEGSTLPAEEAVRQSAEGVVEAPVHTDGDGQDDNDTLTRMTPQRGPSSVASPSVSPTPPPGERQAAAGRTLDVLQGLGFGGADQGPPPQRNAPAGNSGLNGDIASSTDARRVHFASVNETRERTLSGASDQDTTVPQNSTLRDQTGGAEELDSMFFKPTQALAASQMSEASMAGGGLEHSTFNLEDLCKSGMQNESHMDDTPVRDENFHSSQQQRNDGNFHSSSSQQRDAGVGDFPPQPSSISMQNDISFGDFPSRDDDSMPRDSLTRDPVTNDSQFPSRDSFPSSPAVSNGQDSYMGEEPSFESEKNVKLKDQREDMRQEVVGSEDGFSDKQTAGKRTDEQDDVFVDKQKDKHFISDTSPVYIDESGEGVTDLAYHVPLNQVAHNPFDDDASFGPGGEGGDGGEGFSMMMGQSAFEGGGGGMEFDTSEFKSGDEGKAILDADEKENAENEQFLQEEQMDASHLQQTGSSLGLPDSWSLHSHIHMSDRPSWLTDEEVAYTRISVGTFMGSRTEALGSLDGDRFDARVSLCFDS